jgi:type I restriction enzyme, S subunit
MDRNLPNGWKFERLGDVAELIMGQSPPGNTYNTNHNGMPFLQGNAEFGEVSPEHVKCTTMPLKVAPKGSILISIRAPVGDVNIADIDYCIGRGLASLSFYEGDNKFLYYALIFFKNRIESEGVGSTFKAIDKSSLQNFKIPYPSLETQRKIVAIIEKAEATKQFRAQADEFTNQLLQSIFLEMFFNKKDRWISKKLKEFGYLKHGYLYRPKDYIHDGIITIRIGDFDEEDVNTSGCVKVAPSNLEIHKDEIIRKGDIIIALSGATTGKSCLVKKDITALQNYRVGRIVVDKKIALPEYISYFIKTSYFQSLIKNNSVVSAQANVSKENFDNFEISLPPISLQNKFAEIVKYITVMKEQQKPSKEYIDNLFNTLMQKAFRGELVT